MRLPAWAALAIAAGAVLWVASGWWQIGAMCAALIAAAAITIISGRHEHTDDHQGEPTMASKPTSLITYEALRGGEIRLTITGRDQEGRDIEMGITVDARLMVLNVCKEAGLPAPWK